LSRHACAHAHESFIRTSKSRSSRHAFNYDLIDNPNPNTQVSSVWHIPTVPKHEKLQAYHSTQKSLRLVRLALLACTKEGGGLVFDPFAGSDTTAVALKERNRAFVGAELEEEYAELAARRIAATRRGSLLCEISEQFWSGS